MTKNTSRLWLINGISALAIAGLYSIVLVVLRTPQLSHFFSDQSMFKSALVIHVNLSVLVWLLSITCYFWSLTRTDLGVESWLAKIAFISMIFMALSPLEPESVPIMNNYVPMLENIVFIIGLSLFGAVVLCLAILVVLNAFRGRINSDGERLIAIVNFTSAFMFIGVWICFALSYQGLDILSEIVPLDIDFYYEMLFWSGGHLLQFIYTQILMLVLLILAEIWCGKQLRYGSIYEMLFALNFVLALTLFVGHYKYSPADGEFKEFFTLHMIYCAGIVPTIFIATLMLEILQKKVKNAPAFAKLSFSAAAILFLSGGAIGAAISGINVTIPAHYHGSIVGISLAFMGFAYVYCFKENIQNISNLKGIVVIATPKVTINSAKNPLLKLASWQIIIITFGQILHISGLALSGGYGVLRKTPGGITDLSVKFYMGMMGAGGLLAIIGGLMFVYICVRTRFRN
jgi:hypothetical protein